MDYRRAAMLEELKLIAFSDIAHRVSPFCVVERVNVPGALCRRGYVYGAPRLPAQRTVIESQSKRRLRFLAEVVSDFFRRVCFSFEPIVLFLENLSGCRSIYCEHPRVSFSLTYASISVTLNCDSTLAHMKDTSR
jgi:hypothetical protein